MIRRKNPNKRKGNHKAKHSSDNCMTKWWKFPLAVNIPTPIKNMIIERKIKENPVIKMYLIKYFIF
jgi:hypothetical protein